LVFQNTFVLRHQRVLDFHFAYKRELLAFKLDGIAIL
jgi:hypothetical protein